MKKVYLILAATVGMTLASCTTNDYVGEEKNVGSYVDDGSIKFGFDMQNMTRADIAGASAATLLGNNFYVTGTKGTEAATYPTKDLVFDNYLVSFTANTAGTTESNTANWEYVGVTPGIGNWANWVKTGSYSAQTIKYWDYSTSQYDFIAFSTGDKKAVKKTNLTGSGTDPIGGDEIGVTAMNYGENLKENGTAYTFYIPTLEALRKTYVTDVTTVTNSNYGKEVLLKFKNLGSKVRVALYETIPGYSVKNVKFYRVDAATVPTDLATATTYDEATLISGTGGLPTNGEIRVFFPSVGSNNKTKDNYKMVAGEVTPTAAATVGYMGFGELTAQLVGKADAEETGSSKIYLGRSLPEATFAGSSAASYYETLFPVSSSEPLTLRVNYTLVSTDGSKEEINVYGAKAVVPSTYTKWMPNYAYTYIFKISDNTNGWTTATGATTDNQGLYPITFDAVVVEATDADFEQTTITTVATPSITTYQQNHKYTNPTDTPDEYSKGTGKDIYVQVMDNNYSPAVLTGFAPSTLPKLNNTSTALLYEIDPDATEAIVMDALEHRTATDASGNITGRNSIGLKKMAIPEDISSSITTIRNSADNNVISISLGQASKITIANLTVGKSYAYVYDYTTGSKTEVTEFQPIAIANPGTTTLPGASTKTYYTLTTTTLSGITAVTGTDEAVDNDYIYFSKTTNGTGTTTYSYVSVAGKTKLPAGLLKVKKSDITGTAAGGSVSATDTFYFDTYISNNGKYAVKVIKIVA